MSPRTVLVLWFAAGFGLEALYLVRRNPRWGWLGMIAFLSLLVVTPAVMKGPNIVALPAGLALALFGLLFAGLFRDQILPVVSEKLLLTLTVVFWYGFATELYRGTRMQLLLGLAALVPTAATLYAAWTQPVLGFGAKLILYSWYLMIVVALGWLQFPFGNLSIFAGSPAALGWIGPIEAFATGMASLYLLTNVFYLYLLIPIPSKGQSFGDRMKEWHEFTDQMTQRCAEEDGPGDKQTAVVLALIGGGLVLNYVFALLPNPLVISLAIIAAAVLLERAPVPLAQEG